MKLMNVVFGIAVLAACLAGVSAEEKVLTLTNSNFEQALKDHPFMVVEFYAPWCGHCKSLAPEYEKAAQALEGNMDAGVPITLAKVDATVEKELGSRFGVGGYPTLKIFTKGSDKPADYEGPRQADGIVSYLLKRAGPASFNLEDADKAAEMKEKEKVMALFVGKVTEEWTNLADSMRDALTWAHTSDKKVMSKLGVKEGVYVLKQFDEGTVRHDQYKEGKTEELKAFINTHRRQVAMPIRKGDQNALKLVFEDEKVPNAFIFSTGVEDEIAAFKEGCMGVRGDFVTGNFLSTDFPEAFSHFGMDKYITSGGLPKVMVEDRKEGLRYLLEGEVTKDSVAKFLKDFKAGSLEPFLKSEDVPKDNNGPVKVIVGTTFQDEVNNSGKWTLLEAYAPWCGHCKKLAPVWEEVGSAFSEDKTVVIAKIDATANDLPKSLGVQGFPTLLLFKGDGSPPTPYEDERDFDSIAKFVTAKTGAKVKAGFKPSTPSVEKKPAESFDKQVLKFLATDFQVPWMSMGYKVSGLYLAAICVFLLFVASIALVIGVLTRDPAPKAEKKTKTQ